MDEAGLQPLCCLQPQEHLTGWLWTVTPLPKDLPRAACHGVTICCVCSYILPKQGVNGGQNGGYRAAVMQPADQYISSVLQPEFDHGQSVNKSELAIPRQD